MKKYLAALGFSGAPAAIAFALPFGLGAPAWLAAIFGVAFLGLGLSVCLNGSDPVGAERKAP